jgi:CheY-like chemotaxis protein
LGHNNGVSDATRSWRPPEPWHRRFQALMPFRVREILLVSSAYDAFVLEEDGSLSDRLFYQYSELSLSWAPRITHAVNTERALQLLSRRRFDMVMTVVRIGDTDADELSRTIKERHHDIPVVLMIFDEADLQLFPGGRIPITIDHVFQWSGSAATLIAAIKLVEDQRNVRHDTRTAGVQVILVVEDKVRAYSSFLGILYPELLQQAGSLIAEGLNDFHRLMRMRARPKVVLATDFENGLAAFNHLRDHICALMTDVSIPRDGVEEPQAGLDLARLIRHGHADAPILFQTAEADAKPRANELGAWFVRKNSPRFHARVRNFLQEALGFGEFVFRLPDRTEVARASDTYEMEQALLHVPPESVAYHARRNHFSVWLRARSMFALADRIRPRTLAQIDDDVEQLRSDLVAVLQEARWQEQEGVITDFSPRLHAPQNRFVRVGRGSIGGKGRSVAFVNTQIVRHGLLDRLAGLQIRIPKTVVLGTDVFDEFMAQLDVDELLELDDEAITEAFLAHPLPPDAVHDLRAAFDDLSGPLAVRSSSLLEDSRFQPFAGVYATYMMANNHPDPDKRFAEMCRRIKAVYASAFWHEARHYLAGTPHEAEDQKMAVLIQQVIGGRFGERFYPHLSGVAQSHNYYPVGAQLAEDGVATIALGLGHTVVGGGVALRFSPGAPTSRPQYPTAESFARGSQASFLAIDLTAEVPGQPLGAPESTLMRSDLAVAESDGTLDFVGSVYCPEDDVIRDNLQLAGPRVVTFNNILKWNAVPLAEALSMLLKLLRDGVGEEVEIEFALDLADYGRDLPRKQKRRTPRLYVLQVRPMTSPELRGLALDLEATPDDHFVCRTDQSLGHGSIEDIHDVVYVDRASCDPHCSRQVAREVSAINAELHAEGRPYLLVGPGRWGTSDTTLGIPVAWYDIAGARVIVETPLASRHVDPSQGTHFFRNITGLRIGYLTVKDNASSWIDLDWLEQAPLHERRERVRHIRLAKPVAIHLDGRSGSAAVLKPDAKLGEPTEEEPPD